MSHLRLLWKTPKCPRDCTNWLGPLVPARPSQAHWVSALVVDAAPHDVRAMSEGLLATMIQGKDTELEEVAHDEGFLLVRAVTTGWKYYEEGVRDVDELVAVAVEAIEENVTDEDMLTDLMQMIREVLDRPGISVEWEWTMVYSRDCIASVSLGSSAFYSFCTRIHTGTLLSPLDGWLTSHGLWHRRGEAPLC